MTPEENLLYAIFGNATPEGIAKLVMGDEMTKAREAIQRISDAQLDEFREDTLEILELIGDELDRRAGH